MTEPHPGDVLRVLTTRDEMRAFYDKISGFYDVLAESSEGPVRQAGIARLSPAAGETILEIGCGTGHSLVALAGGVAPGGKVFGVELSMGMLEQCRRAVNGNAGGTAAAAVRLICADALHLPLGDDVFDGVFMSFTLELFDTPAIPAVLAECRRVLRPGGRMVVVGMSRSRGRGVMVKTFEWTHRHFPNFLDCRPIFVQQSLEDAGFVTEEVEWRQMWVPVEMRPGPGAAGCRVRRRRHRWLRARVVPAAILLLLSGAGAVADTATQSASAATGATTSVAPEPTRLPLDPELLATGDHAWYGVYAAGSKIGFLRAGYKPATEKGQPVLVFDMSAEMKVKALGQKVDIAMTEEIVFAARAPYRLLHGKSAMTQGPFIRSVEVQAGSDGVTASITEAGSVREMEVGELDYTAEDALTPDIWFRQPRQEGDRLVARSFAILELEPSIDTYDVESRRQSMADGVPVTYYEVRQRTSTLGEVGTFRYDAAGRLLSGVLGGALEIRLESEELAMNADYEADLFVLGMAGVDQPLGDARAVESLVLRVTSETTPSVPGGPRQSTGRSEDGTPLVRLGARWGSPTPGPEDPSKHLAETLDYPIDRPEIRALVSSALGDEERTSWSTVETLVAFVRDFIDDSYTAQPLTVMDVLEVRRGDCTEHALLFTTLARAAGIPTREVGGLIYMGDSEQAFGGHAWNEVLVDGHWVAVDPLWGETEINATHISFGPLSGEDAGLFTLLGGYSFAVESVERRP